MQKVVAAKIELTRVQQRPRTVAAQQRPAIARFLLEVGERGVDVAQQGEHRMFGGMIEERLCGVKE